MSDLNEVQTYGIAGMSAVRVGCFAVVAVSMSTSLPDPWSRAVVATLPAGLRPAHFDVAAPCATANGAFSCTVTVKTDGRVELANVGGAASGANTKVGSVAFIADA